MKLAYTALSPYCRKVRMAMEYQGIEFEIITADAEDLFLDFTTGIDRVVLDRLALGIAAGATIATMWQSGVALPGMFGGTTPVLFYDTNFRALFLDVDGGSSANAVALFSLDEGCSLALGDLLLV